MWYNISTSKFLSRPYDLKRVSRMKSNRVYDLIPHAADTSCF